MTTRTPESVLVECLEEWHRRRGLGENPSPEEFRERAGAAFGEFVALLAAEARFDEAVAPPPADPGFPRPFGEYTLLRELGRGAMGVVYEAMQRGLERKVALKVLRTGFDTDDVARERFRREARAAAHIRHPSIVEIYDAGETDGQPYYSMAPIDGRPLQDLAKSGELPPPRELARLLADVADALDVLHREGIVHRDVKPSNILLAKSGRMVLADFGLARTAAERLTTTGQALGTPLYMSPEQVMGRTEEVDGRSDVYGLGATMYEVFTGRPLFQANEPVAILRMILKDRPARPSEARPDIDRDLENVILKAVEKLKDDRYPTAGALRDDLLAYAAGGEVAGRPVSPVRHGLRGAARWWPAGLAAAVVAAAGAYAWNRRAATFSVHSYPASQALVDGRDVGRTPFELSLPAGTHELVLRADGFRDLTREVSLAAGGQLAIEPVLAPLDAEDPRALAALAAEFQVALADYRPDTLRAAGQFADPFTALPLLPRGNVRASDAATWSMEAGGLLDPGGRVEFRSGGRVLATVPFDPAKTGVVTGAMPNEVVDAFVKGGEIEWGYVPAQGDAILTTCKAARAGADAKAGRVTRLLAEQPGSCRPIAVQCLLESGLHAEAYREAMAHVAEHAGSVRGWAMACEALRRMRLEDSGLYAKARAGLEAARRGDGARGTK
jgi:predicted Ser/Thr protein kinase